MRKDILCVLLAGAGLLAVSAKQTEPDPSWTRILVQVKSTLDGTLQPCYFWAPDESKTNAVPLIVGLHTWSADYRQTSHYATVLKYARAKGWAMVGPNFRGPNKTPPACGGDPAVQDIVDAVNYAKAHVKIDPARVYIVGGSGGGHMTLLMLGRHPEIFAAGAAFCPITDLARWHADSLLVQVENPKARVTTVENAPIDPATWDIAQSGGKDRIVTALENGLQIDFTGASSRNPYIKISKAVRMWGIPDTLRLRLEPGTLQLKSVKILLENGYGERVTVEYPISTVADGPIVLDVPATDICDAADLGNFPLHLVYYYITYNSVTTGEQYSLKIPGMELVYANMPPDEHPATGDVNLDGEVNIADINAVIDMILSGNVLSVGDVNGDGEVNIADVNALIALILS